MPTTACSPPPPPPGKCQACMRQGHQAVFATADAQGCRVPWVPRPGFLQRPLPSKLLLSLNEIVWVKGLHGMGALVILVISPAKSCLCWGWPSPLYPKRKWRLREDQRLPQGHTAWAGLRMVPEPQGMESSPFRTLLPVQVPELLRPEAASRAFSPLPRWAGCIPYLDLS